MISKANLNTLKKHGFILLLTAGLLFGLRLVWYSVQAPPDAPHAVNGVLDMRGWNFEDSKSITLNGEWEFYPDKLLSDGNGKLPEPARYVKVPGDWRSGFSDSRANSYGTGTYRLRILIDQPLNQPYSMWFRKIESSSAVFINGEQQSAFGALSERKDESQSRVTSYTVSYTANGQQELDVLIQTANDDNPFWGGILKAIKFGSQAAIDSERLYSIGFQLVVFIVLLLHSLYAVILFFFNPKEKSFIFFGLLLLLTALSIVSDHDNLLQLWLPINYTWSLKIRMLSYASISFFMLLLARTFHKDAENRRARLFRTYVTLFVLFVLFILVSPVKGVLYSYYLKVFDLIYLLPMVGVVYLIAKMVIQSQRDALFLLLAAAGVSSSVYWGALQNVGTVDSIFYPVDMIAAIISFCAYWFKRYFRNTEENAELTGRLRQADKVKDDFLANTSHELRTPLHGIMNIAQTVITNEQQGMNPKSVKDMELLITISRRMSSLLGDLLDISRLQDKKIVLRLERLQLQAIVPSVIAMLGYLTDGKLLRMEMKIPDDFPPVYGDEKRLMQILVNLLQNAIKYTDTGTITVSAEIVNDKAIIRVADTGAGMDEETAARVFKPYEQGALGINDGGGFGLGLGICKQLIELHGGVLVLDSTSGQGSVFSFTLPLYAGLGGDLSSEVAAAGDLEPFGTPYTDGKVTLPAAEKPEPSTLRYTRSMPALPTVPVLQDTSSFSASGSLNILVVDDDPVNLRVLGGMLSDAHYYLVPALSGKEALELLDRGRWDLVIADVMMPHMSGYELTRIIRERYSVSELPVLLLTARAQPEDIYTGFLAGASDYVIKPVDALELQYRVRSLTMLKQSLDERLRMEAAYLQAQIRPHFLFNALNSILALSDIDSDKMTRLGEAFTSYLRINFDLLNAEELVPLSHELELVRAYLYIEQERFEDRLSVEWQMEKDIDSDKVNGPQLPPLTIQPLVENAVRHGLLSQARGGVLKISITRHAGEIRIEVRDDGKGMEPDQVALLLEPSQQGKGGIGLQNTNRRLKRLYGKGLIIQSQPGAGTSVSFAVPDQRGADLGTITID
ncbi:ATP-binding protein [Paenibacillus sp. NPDC057934]|uniref:hybrid sensor histidine kinase/response regulator n=1 Tax=Paenibacillus sp. NPDC057934 TaxID=3346282 RepID=UPI0036DEC2B1